jgi:outer membrane protein
MRSDEPRADRIAYSAESTLNSEISLRVDYLIDPKQAAFGVLEHTALASEIRDSPLVDQFREESILLGYLNRFR